MANFKWIKEDSSGKYQIGYLNGWGFIVEVMGYGVELRIGTTVIGVYQTVRGAKNAAKRYVNKRIELARKH